jgi:phosphomannomutase/phosphoglucomutase
MRGIFSILSVFAVAMVLGSSVAVFGLSHSTLQQAKQESAAALAGGVGYAVAVQMQMLERTVEQIATDDDVILAVESADAVLMDSVAAKVQKFLPDAMKVRLLPANVNTVDESVVPNMGYADLEMVKRTLTAKQTAIIQGEGENRHLAITAGIKKGEQTIGVVLARLKYYFLQSTMDKLPITEHFIEISQANVALGSNGDMNVKTDTPRQINIDNSAWQVAYWSAGARDFSDISLIIGVVVFFSGLAACGLFVGYSKTTWLLKRDQNKVLEAVKDLMTGKELGGYQVNLTEMQIIISTLAQFKRILDNKQSRSAENGEQVKLNDKDMLELAQATTQVTNKKYSANAVKKKI